MKTLRSLFRTMLGLPWLPLWLTPLILLAPVLFTGRPVYWGAAFLQFTPWRALAFNQVLSGSLPLWNPLSGMGAPLAANYQSALFYPPTWLLLPFYRFGGAQALAVGETWLVYFHILWAGLGMAFFLRRLGCGRFAQTIGSLACSLSVFLVARSSFFSINATVAWLPWLLVAAERLRDAPARSTRWLVAGGLVTGMLLLAGHAQNAFYGLLFASLWVLFRSVGSGWKAVGSRLLKWAGMVLLGCGLAAVQLIPTAEYLLQSQRSAEIGYDYAVNYSFLPWRFLTLLLPNLFGTPANGTYMLKADAFWEDAIYVGLLPLILALVGVVRSLILRARNEPERARKRLNLFLLVAALLSALIALGRYTPVFPFLYQHIPTFDLFQAPARWMIWLVLAFSILAGLGAEAWKKPGRVTRAWCNRATALGATIALASLAGTGLLPRLDLAGDTSGQLGVFIRAFLVFGFSLVLIAQFWKHQPSPDDEKAWKLPLWQGLVIGFVCVDLIMANCGLHPAAAEGLYPDAVRSAQQVREMAGGGRLFITDADLESLQYDAFFDFRDFRPNGSEERLAQAVLPDTNLLGGLASLNNFDPLVPSRYRTFMDWLNGLDPASRSPVLARVGVSLVESPAGEGGQVRFDPVSGSARIRWTDCALSVAEEDSGANLEEFLVQAQEPLPEQAVLLEDIRSKWGDCSGQTAFVNVVLEKADEIRIELDAPADGYLVVADGNYPGWQAWIDGQKAEILKADYLFRAVLVPAGRHEVRMAYRPAPVFVGGGISLVSLLILGILWKVESKKVKPSAAT